METENGNTPTLNPVPEAVARPPHANRNGGWFARQWKRISPGPRAWRGAAWGLLSGTFIIFLAVAYTNFAHPGPHERAQLQRLLPSGPRRRKPKRETRIKAVYFVPSPYALTIASHPSCVHLVSRCQRSLLQCGL